MAALTLPSTRYEKMMANLSSASSHCVSACPIAQNVASIDASPFFGSGSGRSRGPFFHMAKKISKKAGDGIEDEPGAEARFLSGVRKALETPHKPHKPKSAAKKGRKQ